MIQVMFELHSKTNQWISLGVPCAKMPAPFSFVAVK